ncbi:MAG: hypothetical protein KatS3mg103_0762 [Phycisphaerales bacterium]|nr:MAG: hypothetical protein KatS3mg103_0762 [Phycisphaerales bacterium]
MQQPPAKVARGARAGVIGPAWSGRPGHWRPGVVLAWALAAWAWMGLVPAGAPWALVRPAAGQGDEPARAGVQDQPQGEAQRLGALIRRRLDVLRQQQARLEALLADLDAGRDPRDVFAELRSPGEGPPDGRPVPRDDPFGPLQAEPTEAIEPASPGGGQDATAWRRRVMAFLDEHAPEIAQRLREDGQSEQAQRALQRLRREVERLIELRQRDAEQFAPQLQRLRTGMRIAEVVARLRRQAAQGPIGSQELEAYRRALTEPVAAQFDAELAARQRFLERTEQRMQAARQRLEEERAQRDERIAAEVQAILDRTLHGPEGTPRPGATGPGGRRPGPDRPGPDRPSPDRPGRPGPR